MHNTVSHAHHRLCESISDLSIVDSKNRKKERRSLGKDCNRFSEFGDRTRDKICHRTVKAVKRFRKWIQTQWARGLREGYGRYECQQHGAKVRVRFHAFIAHYIFIVGLCPGYGYIPD